MQGIVAALKGPLVDLQRRIPCYLHALLERYEDYTELYNHLAPMFIGNKKWISKLRT